MERISRAVKLGIGVAALSLGLLSASVASAQTGTAKNSIPGPSVSGKIIWGAWIDPDGCMHWWADGGLEGYMLDRVYPATGKPVCLKRNTCLVENTDQMFATDSAQLTGEGRRRLQKFFTDSGAFGYAVYGHTDSRASDEYNMKLSQRRAEAVAGVARSVGAVVDRQVGFGEREPRASNASAEGMRQNRRVEIVCYRW
jgi:outer membrane protein OmpA-like peptidoglycan-associated protein